MKRKTKMETKTKMKTKMKNKMKSKSKIKIKMNFHLVWRSIGGQLSLDWPRSAIALRNMAPSIIRI